MLLVGTLPGLLVLTPWLPVDGLWGNNRELLGPNAWFLQGLMGPISWLPIGRLRAGIGGMWMLLRPQTRLDRYLPPLLGRIALVAVNLPVLLWCMACMAVPWPLLLGRKAFVAISLPSLRWLRRIACRAIPLPLMLGSMACMALLSLVLLRFMACLPVVFPTLFWCGLPAHCLP